MLPNLWEQITHSPFSSLTLWGCHQRIVSCSGVCRREVAESCSVPFTHGFSISCHGSCNIQTASQKGEAKKGSHTPFTAPPSSPRPGSRQCNTAAAEPRRTQCQQRETKTRHQHGPGEGSGDGPAGAIAVLVCGIQQDWLSGGMTPRLTGKSRI